MHDGNYDPEDTRCVKHKYLIEALEKHRVNFETKEDSQLYSRDVELQRSLDIIYRYFKKDIGYAPAWLMNALDRKMSGKGRPQLYSFDDRIENSIFVDHMVQRGSSITQAIKLLAPMVGNKSISEGFIKETRASYNEFKEGGWDQEYQDLVEMGWVISDMLAFDLDREPIGSELAFKKAVAALRGFWQEVIDLMKEFYPAIKDFDHTYIKNYDELFPWIHEDLSDPLEYFYWHPANRETNLEQRKAYLREYINCISCLKNGFDGKSRGPGEPDWDAIALIE